MYRYTDSSELQDCPAAVDMETGDIWINTDVWNRYTEAEKRFIIGHELGHYELPTDCETEADEYALQKNFGQIKDSLRSSFTALEKTNVKNEKRWAELYENALEIDAEHGNDRAAQELEQIKYKQQKSNTMRNIPGQITYIKNQPLRGFCYADGEEEAEQEVANNLYNSNLSGEGPIDCLRNGKGITVGGVHLSTTDIILVAIAVILLIKLK